MPNLYKAARALQTMALALPSPAQEPNFKQTQKGHRASIVMQHEVPVQSYEAFAAPRTCSCPGLE